MSGSTVVRIDRRGDPLADLSDEERTRLIVRILCELVAYGEPETATSDGHPEVRAAS